MREDILTKALEQALEESFDEMIDQDIPDYAFSPEFEKKMDMLIRDQQTVTEKRKNIILRYSATAAAAALICFTAGIAYEHRPKRIHEQPNGIISEESTTSSEQNASSPSVKTDEDAAGQTVSKTETHASSAIVSSQATESTVKADKETQNVITHQIVTTAEERDNVHSQMRSTSVTSADTEQKRTNTHNTTQNRSSSGNNTTTSKNTYSATTSEITTSQTTTEIYSTTSVIYTSTSYNYNTTTMFVSSTPPSTTTSVNDISDERSSYMKKLTAFLAACIASSPVSNIQQPAIQDSNAIDTNIAEASPFVFSYNYNEGDLMEYIPKIRNDESNMDLNKDGSIDIEDIYAYFCLWDGQTFKNPENFDFSGITITVTNDEGLEYERPKYELIDVYRYFATYYTITPEMISKEPFIEFCVENIVFPYNSDPELNSEWLSSEFLDRFIFDTNYICQFYDMFRDKVESKEVDLDLNSDGVYDLWDVFCYCSFSSAIPYTDTYRLNKFLDDPVDVELETDQIKKCVELIRGFEYNNSYPLMSSFEKYMLQYYMEDHPFDPAWTDEQFYNDVGYPGSLTEYFAPVQYNLGFGFNDMKICYPDATAQNISYEYDKFKNLADSGKHTVPDINNDGIIDLGDFRLAMLFFSEYRYIKDIPLPEEYRQTFLTDFDLNDNRMSGDINDLAIYQLYIADILNIEENDFASELIKYYDKHPEFDKEHASNYRAIPYDPVFEENWEAIYSSYVDDVDSGRKEKPDVNMDGVIDLDDYIQADIMLNDATYNNNYRMAIVSDETKEHFFESFDIDGDGEAAAWNDLSLLRLYVADTLGYEINSIYISEKFNMDAEFFISKYDDILPEEEKTMYAMLDPEMVKDLTPEQKIALMTISYEEEKNIKDNIIHTISSMTDEQKDKLDINRNGLIDCEDFRMTHDLKNLYLKDDTVDSSMSKDLTDDIKEFFFSNFDFNDNGVSGDYADFLIADHAYEKLMVSIPVNTEDDFNAADKNKKENAINKANELREAKRNGDANVDGNTDISDSVIIMQSYANPSKYQLTDEGRFNGDLFATGDGITPKDALEIQKLLLFKQ